MVIKPAYPADTITLSGTTYITNLKEVSVQYNTASNLNPLVVDSDQRVYQVQKHLDDIISDIATDKIDEIKPLMYSNSYEAFGVAPSGHDNYYELCVMKANGDTTNGGSLILEASFGGYEYEQQSYCAFQLSTRGGLYITGFKNVANNENSDLIITKDNGGKFHLYLERFNGHYTADNIIIKKYNSGMMVSINKYLPSPATTFSGSIVWRYSIDEKLTVINPPNYYSPFSRILKIDSSTPITLGVGESCVLYPITVTASIGFKLSASGSYTYVAAGTVIQNTSYYTSIKTGPGLMRGYDVGSYYRCYYGTSTYTYSVTSYQNGVGINTTSVTVPLYTSVSCLACVLKKSV